MGTCCLGAKGLVIPPKASAKVAAPTLVLVLVLVVDDLGANADVDETREAATDRAATDLELMNMLTGWLTRDILGYMSTKDAFATCELPLVRLLLLQIEEKVRTWSVWRRRKDKLSFVRGTTYSTSTY